MLGTINLCAQDSGSASSSPSIRRHALLPREPTRTTISPPSHPPENHNPSSERLSLFADIRDSSPFTTALLSPSLANGSSHAQASAPTNFPMAPATTPPPGFATSLGPFGPTLSPASAEAMLRNYFPADVDEEVSTEEQTPEPETHTTAPDLTNKRKLGQFETEVAGLKATSEEWISQDDAPQTPPKKKRMVVVLRTPSHSPHTLSPVSVEDQKIYKEPPRCDHPRHPAHAAPYSEPECPGCRFARSKTSLKWIENIISKQGGVDQWLERIHDPSIPEEKKHALMFEQAVRGGSPRKPDFATFDAYGNDKSHRHNRKRLANLAIDLKRLSKLELEWEREHPFEYEAIPAEDRRVLHLHSATRAIWKYRKDFKEGTFHQVENECVTVARKRGREWEISTDPKCPEDDFEGEKPHGWLKITPEQRAFIDASHVPSVKEADYAAEAANEQRKPKRRRTDAEVTFNEEVSVCMEADIDVLRKSTASTSVECIDDAACNEEHSLPGAFPLSPLAVVEPTPTLPRKVYLLNDGESRYRGFYRHLSTRYKPGEWAPSEGSKIVDTSGYHWKDNFDTWDRYTQWMQHEADDWDAQYAEQVDEVPSETTTQYPGPTLGGAIGAVAVGGLAAALLAHMVQKG